MLPGILLTLALALELELKLKLALAALLPCFLVLCGTHITYLYVSMCIMREWDRERMRGRERGCSYCMAACGWI